jgi:thiol:disulfide interchange protein DsbA
MQLVFLSAQGVNESRFNSAYDSMSVASNMLRAEEVTKKFAVANVPVMIVNGKYMTSVSEAGSEDKLIALVNDLAASEKAR